MQRKTGFCRSALRRWHAWLQTDRGARAALRRVRRLDEVWMEEAYSRLRLALLPDFRFADEPLARAAVAVAEVNEAHADGLAARASSVVRGRPAVSPERMRLMLGAEEPDDFLRLLRGALPMIDRTVALGDLADLVLSWHGETGRAIARRRVMLAYYERRPEAAA